MALDEHVLVLKVENGKLRADAASRISTSSAISRVFHYQYANLYMCVVQVDMDGAAAAMAADDTSGWELMETKTNAIVTPIVKVLFEPIAPGLVTFQWVAVPQAALADDQSPSPVVEAIGASGGASIGGR